VTDRHRSSIGRETTIVVLFSVMLLPLCSIKIYVRERGVVR
jgi:hypothetical protein